VNAEVKQDEIYQQLLDGQRILKERDFNNEDKPTVYLTFDDGPSGLTPKVLDILKRENIKATFFVLGQSAKDKPEVVKRITEEGHSIGNHSYTHRYKNLYQSFADYWDEITKTEKAIYDIAGVRTSLVRTPGGTYKNWDSFYFYYMDQEDYLVFDWNVDSGDSKRVGVPTKEIIKNIKQSRLSNKLVVLMHDANGHENTVEALPEIIKFYKEQGYQFGALTEEVEPVMQPNTVSRWKRPDEFNKRSLFVRANIPNKEVAEKGEITEASKIVTSNEGKYIDVWQRYPYHKKVGTVYYDYADENWWIPLSELTTLTSGKWDKTKYLSNELKKVDQKWYAPLLLTIDELNKTIYWNGQMNYLVLNTKIESKLIVENWSPKFRWLVDSTSKNLLTLPSLTIYEVVR